MTTVSDAWDHIHRLFGVGDFDELDSPVPWWQWRRDQIMRLKARATKVGQTPEDLIRAADYCKAEGIDIRNATWVTKYYYDAKRWERQRDNERSRVSIEDEISDAVSIEMGFDKESPWISKLMLAQGEYREEVLAEWRQWNQQRPSSSRSVGKARGGRTA